MARLDRTADVKEIAQTAACIGREFDFELLTAISERSEAELVAGIDRLGAAELVFRRGFGTGGRYIFKHALVRDAAYESLLKSSRQAIHARLVAALEVAGMEAPPEILARHAELAGMTDRAIQEYHRAGDAAGARPAYAEAVASYDAALRLLATQAEGRGRDEHQLAIEIARGQALMAHFGYAAPKTGEAFARARVLAEQVGDARSLFHVDWGQWQVSNVQADLPEALARGRRALAACEPDDPANIRPLAYRLVGSPLVAMGRFAEAATHLQESLACYDPDRHADHTRRFGSDTRAVSLIWLASARWFQGAVDAALTDMEASLALVRQLDNAFARCQGLGHIGVLRTLIDPAGADASVAELLASTHRHGVQFFQAVGHGLRTGVRTAQGDHRGALDDAARARDGFSRSGARIFQPLVLNFAAQAQMALGRFDDAAATLVDIDAMIEAGQRWGEAETRRVEGDLMLARGDAAAAEACWRRAIAVAQAQGAASWELRATARLARLLVDRVATNDAAILLAEAFKKIDGGRDTPDVVVASAMLRKLGASL
jgi:tetratricopeptide (TPR) repeat protein